MALTRSPAEIHWARVAAAAAFLLAITLISATVLRNSASGVTDTIGDNQEYLNDLVANRDVAAAAVWTSGFASLLLLGVFAGLYVGLRRWGEELMRVALIAGVSAAALNLVRVAAQAAVVGHIVPEWGVSPNALRRGVLQSDFRVLEWFSSAIGSGFDVALAVAMIAASIVMLRGGRTLWTRLGWIGLAGGSAGLVDAFWLLEGGLKIAGLVQLAATLAWLLGLSLALRPRSWYEGLTMSG